MHIPDGYLSPLTAAMAYGVAVPFWYQASRRVARSLASPAAPLVAVFAAFSFTIQMFNIPVPGGTTAHVVGGTLMAVAVGPWTAVLGISTALVLQALFFGDGGITTLGANALNLAVALPLSGYAAYRLIAGANPTPRRRTMAAAIGSYVGINVAALLAGLELGIQPIFWMESGRALYSPYGLQVTVPMMLLVHLTLVGFAEAALTWLAVGYLLRAQPGLWAVGGGQGSGNEGAASGAGYHGSGHEGGNAGLAARRPRGPARGLAVGLGVAILVTPVGLLAPGVAGFEWGTEEVRAMVGYAPAGLARLSGAWPFAPLRGYGVPGLGSGASFLQQAPGYLISAMVGVALIFALLFAARVFLGRRTDPM